MDLTTTFASMRVCHLRTSDRSLSEVKSSPWKLVRQFLPCTSSTLSLTFLNAWSSSFCRSARDTSKILPFRASFAFFRPVVLLTSVFPTLKILAFEYYERGLCHTRGFETWTAPDECQSKSISYSIFSCLDRVPVLASERVLCSLLETFLAFGKALIPIAIISAPNILEIYGDDAAPYTDFPTAMIMVSNKVHDLVDSQPL